MDEWAERAMYTFIPEHRTNLIHLSQTSLHQLLQAQLLCNPQPQSRPLPVIVCGGLKRPRNRTTRIRGQYRRTNFGKAFVIEELLEHKFNVMSQAKQVTFLALSEEVELRETRKGSLVRDRGWYGVQSRCKKDREE
jgi:hypothetical protein